MSGPVLSFMTGLPSVPLKYCFSYADDSKWREHTRISRPSMSSRQILEIKIKYSKKCRVFIFMLSHLLSHSLALSWLVGMRCRVTPGAGLPLHPLAPQ